MRAALATYFHGMTEEIALQEIGQGGLPIVRRLLADPTFPRRDNLIAFLDAIGGPEDRDAVLSFLRNPPSAVEVPEEDRALLLAPQALGRMAERGDGGALAALLAMTMHRGEGGILEHAAARSSSPANLRDDLLEMAVRGLALSGALEGRDRLAALASGTVVPARGGRGLQRQARQALILFDQETTGGTADRSPGARRLDAQPDLAVDDSGLPAASLTASGSLDTQTRVHTAGITYANHVLVTNPMTDTTLDAVLSTASLRAGRGDFAEDVACCCTVFRSGSARTFGTTTDALDVIDDTTELSAVLGNPAARFKVVRAINNCGANGTNIIGCAWRPGNGAAVVRMSSLAGEAVLWLHEYGHNTGLPHNTAATRLLMYGVDYGTNDGLTQTECNTYHTPSTNSGMATTDIGACTDLDVDLVQTLADNCPTTTNSDQADADRDGTGDACESTTAPVCGNGLRETGEACDGADLGGQTCTSRGFDGGTLACTAACTLDTTACIASLCGNGTRDGSEACDGADLGGQTCTSRGFDGGTLACTTACTFNLSGCTCVDADGDGVARCDGDCDDNSSTVYPGAREICSDGIDQDCNGTDKRKGCPKLTEDCRNGVDDDRDSFVDCADSDCASRRACR